MPVDITVTKFFFLINRITSHHEITTSSASSLSCVCYQISNVRTAKQCEILKQSNLIAPITPSLKIPYSFFGSHFII
jgi:hypothetical protein